MWVNNKEYLLFIAEADCFAYDNKIMQYRGGWVKFQPVRSEIMWRFTKVSDADYEPFIYILCFVIPQILSNIMHVPLKLSSSSKFNIAYRFLFAESFRYQWSLP